MPVRHAQALGQSGKPQAFQDAVFDEARSSVGKPGVRLDARITRCKLGAASEAWSETSRLGCGRTREKRAALTPRRFHGADGPAVDACRLHGGKEAAVKPRITGEQSLVAYVGIKFHQRNITACETEFSPFSDMGVKKIEMISGFALVQPFRVRGTEKNPETGPKWTISYHGYSIMVTRCLADKRGNEWNSAPLW